MTTSAANFRYPAIQGEDGHGRRSEFEVELEDEFEDFAQLGEFEFEEEDEAEDELEEEFEFEYEVEAEREEEDEDFVNPVRRIYRDAELMAHLAGRAAKAADEAEAEAFLGAMVPMAARLVPRAEEILSRSAPALVRGVSRLGRQLRKNPATRSFLTTVPVILQRTAQSLADQAASGRPPRPESVIRTFATVASRVLRQPADRRRAADAVGVFDRRFHDRHGGGGSPSPRPAKRPAPRRGRRRR
ncbi:hypothetical protein [Actinoplanes sp. NPDC051851]|uniref:hypothetical protein n=1 Tax=Actinoplanes sp. NPDC051851 TaxID=3154753 RepID=UPI00341C0484